MKFVLRLIFVLALVPVWSAASWAQGGVNQGGEQAQSQNGAAQAMNAAMGASMIAACMSSSPPNIPLCIMGALAMMQAAANGSNGSSAGVTAADAFDGVALPAGPGTSETLAGEGGRGLGSENGSGLSIGQQRDLDSVRDLLAENGFEIDESGAVSGPNGSIPNAAFGNSEELKKYFESDEVKTAQSALNEAIKKNPYNVAAVPLEGGGGGFGRSGVKKPLETSTFDFNLQGAQNRLAEQLQKKGRVEGLSRSIAGGRIGVAEDDIFKMVSRRYQVKQRARYFLP